MSGRQEVIQSVEALVELLSQSIRGVAPELESMEPGARQDVQKRLRESDMLTQRVAALIRYCCYYVSAIFTLRYDYSTLEDVLQSASQLQHSSSISKFWHARNDAETLRGIHKRIEQATDRFRVRNQIYPYKYLADKEFQIQGEITVQQLLAKEVDEARETVNTLKASWFHKVTRHRFLRCTSVWS